MSTNKKRVLVMTTTYPTFTPGDATPPFVHELTKRLAAEGLEMIVLAPRRPGTKSYEEQDGVKIHRYGYFFSSQWEKLADGAILPNIKKNKWLMLQVPFFLVSGFLGLIRLIKKNNIKIIHCHRIVTNGFLCALYKKFINKNIQLIVTSHGGDAFLSKGLFGGVANRMKKFTMKYINKLTVVSSAIEKLFKPLTSINNTDTYVIPMGVDTEQFTPDNYDESIKKKYNIEGHFLLFVGRLAEKKGIRYLVDAMPDIVNEYKNIKLLIIGGGPLEFELKNQTNKLGLKDNIIFTGPIPNSELPKYYATADVFVGPSIIADDGDTEGLPVTYMEAMSSGCAVIGSDLEGNTDILSDGVNGFICKQKSVKSIASCIQKAIINNSMSTRDHVENYFSYTVITKRFLKVLISL